MTYVISKREDLPPLAGTLWQPYGRIPPPVLSFKSVPIGTWVDRNIFGQKS